MSENQAPSPRRKIVIAAAIIVLAIVVVGIGALLPQRISNHRCRRGTDCAQTSATQSDEWSLRQVGRIRGMNDGVLRRLDPEPLEPPPPSPKKSELATKMPDAVQAYKKGMKYFLADGVPRNLDLAEQKFKEAANLGLPHGHFGIACVIYQKGDHERTGEAFDELNYAADRHVLDALAALAAYHLTGYGTPIDGFKGRDLVEEANEFASNPPLGSGDPEYTYEYTNRGGKKHVTDFIESGLCAPPVTNWVNPLKP